EGPDLRGDGRRTDLQDRAGPDLGAHRRPRALRGALLLVPGAARGARRRQEEPAGERREREDPGAGAGRGWGGQTAVVHDLLPFQIRREGGPQSSPTRLAAGTKGSCATAVSAVRTSQHGCHSRGTVKVPTQPR